MGKSKKVDEGDAAIFVTKWYLTQGILGIPANLIVKRDDTIVRFRTEPNGWQVLVHGRGKAWHETLEGALDAATKMRDRKIASLQKQLAKLEKDVPSTRVKLL